MRLISVLVLAAACAVCFASSASAAGNTFFVGPSFAVGGNLNCSFPATNSINAAVTLASPGDTIVVCDGVYPEQVVVNKSVTLAGSGNAIIQPTLLTGDFDAVTVGAGASVTMWGFVVSGPGPGGCGSIGAGVRVRDNATLDLSLSEIRDIRDVGDNSPYPFSGCQNGEGIRVGARGGVGGPGHATIDNVVVTHYQKNGITVSGAGTTAKITNTTVTGFGANSLIAQNGIQVSSGAAATISTSTIRDNDYTPKSFVACGLLWFDANGVNDDTNVYLNNEKDKCGANGRGGTYDGAQ
jgi:parallel beta helix pectate lyase-like protein